MGVLGEWGGHAQARCYIYIYIYIYISAQVVLGYFSLVAMSRVHVMCGDYYAALKAVRHFVLIFYNLHIVQLPPRHPRGCAARAARRARARKGRICVCVGREGGGLKERAAGLTD